MVDEIRAAGCVAVANHDSVATAEGGEGIIKTALDNWGRIDIMVNVAGIVRDRMIFNMTEEEWDAVLAVHLKGHFNTIKPASILMRQQRGGRIINFSSVSGLIGNPGQANYGAAKAAIAGLTRVVARDLGRYGVTCNAISPGAATRMTESVSDAALAARARAGVSSGTMMVAGGQAEAYQVPRDPEYVASMVAWLAGDSAWDVNGKIFHVVGGTIALASEEVPAVTIRKESGAWTVGELAGMVPTYLMRDVINPAPPAADQIGRAHV